jgi:hypothetical protein
VAAAASKLPEDHPWIERIQFLYGSAIPRTGGVLNLREEDAPIAGYVVFTYVTGSREYVDVSLWRDTLHVGAPLPYGEPD